MQYLVLVSRSSPPPNETPTAAERQAEQEVIRNLYVDGVVRQIWLRDGGAVILAEGDSAPALERTFSALPLVKSGFLQTPTVIALKPYPGFGPQLGE